MRSRRPTGRGCRWSFSRVRRDYYGQRGFRAAEELGFRPPTLRYPPGAFQVARLSAYRDWMTGTFVYSETFWALDCVGLRGPRLSRVRRNLRNSVTA